MFYGGLLWLFHCSDNINEPNQVATCRPKRLHWCWIILFAQSFNHYYLVFKHWRIYLSTLHGLQDFLDTGWWSQELWCRAISCLTQQSETYQENRPISFAGCTWKKLIKAMCIIFFPCHFKNQNKKSHTSACCTGTFDPKKNSLSLFSVFSQRFISDFDTPKTYWVHPVYHKTLHQVKWFKEQEYRCPFYSIYLYDYQHKNKMYRVTSQR